MLLDVQPMIRLRQAVLDTLRQLAAWVPAERSPDRWVLRPRKMVLGGDCCCRTLGLRSTPGAARHPTCHPVASARSAKHWAGTTTLGREQQTTRTQPGAPGLPVDQARQERMSVKEGTICWRASGTQACAIPFRAATTLKAG